LGDPAKARLALRITVHSIRNLFPHAAL